MNDLEDVCVWHKNDSIEKTNTMYTKCHVTCDGYDKGCPKYLATKEYILQNYKSAHKNQIDTKYENRECDETTE